MSEQKRTLVEEGTEFRGAMTSSCPVVVRGKIEGELRAPSLSVSTTGAVHGKAVLGEVSSEGELAGEFDADVVRLSGRVQDNTVIRAKVLEVKLASEDRKMQVTFGNTELAIGDLPTDARRKSDGTVAPVPPIEAT